MDRMTTFTSGGASTLSKHILWPLHTTLRTWHEEHDPSKARHVDGVNRLEMLSALRVAAAVQNAALPTALMIDLSG